MLLTHSSSTSFFFNDPSTPEIYTLSLHDALPISDADERFHHRPLLVDPPVAGGGLQHRILSAHVIGTGRVPERVLHARERSEEHTSELQSPYDLVCRLLLEKKKKKIRQSDAF